MESLPEVVWLQESIGGSSVNAVTELAFARSLDSDLDVVLTGDGNGLGWGIWDSRPLAAEDTDAFFASVHAKLRRLVPADLVEKLLRPDSSSDDRLGRKLAAARLRTGSLDNDLIALDCEVYGENGPLRSEAGKTVERILLRPDAALARHVDVAFVRQLLRRHRARPRWWSPRARAEDHTVALMMLLALEIWLRLFLESADLARPPRLGELF